MSEKTESFESAQQKLESIIQALEKEDLTLEKALKHFEAGIKLIRICKSHLNNAQGRILELVKGEEGAFIEKMMGLTLDASQGEVHLDET